MLYLSMKKLAIFSILLSFSLHSQNFDINAGPDISVCEDQMAVLSNATASGNYSDVLWTSSGDGIFSNDLSINPTYSLGLNDILSGAVTLTFKGYGYADGAAVVISDEMTVYIASNPTVFLGNDNEVNAGDSYQIVGAYASDYSYIQWTTSGDGSFDNPNIFNPIYTPSQQDYERGYVDLTLEAYAIDPCGTPASDRMTIFFIDLPEAGDDQTICRYDCVNLNQAYVGGNYSSILWTSTGNGIFSDETTLNTTYCPDAVDIASGGVTLRLTVNGANNQQLYDEVQIFITECNADILLSGTISAKNNQIKNVSNPTDSQDAVTKSYLDNLFEDNVSMRLSKLNISKIVTDNQTVQLTSKSFVFVNASNTTIVLPEESQVSEMDVIYIYSLRATNNAPIEDCAITFTSNSHSISSYKVNEGLITASAGQKIYGRFHISGLQTILFMDGKWFLGSFSPYSIID